jgi:transposase
VRKGQRYGTIILDLERHRPIAMLADRDAESLANWLREHPTIRIIAHDRAGTYAEAATKGAPDAVQVADRFHILRNLSETLLVVFEQHAKQLCRLPTGSPAGAVPPSALEHVTPAVTDELIRTIPPPTPSLPLIG